MTATPTILRLSALVAGIVTAGAEDPAGTFTVCKQSRDPKTGQVRQVAQQWEASKTALIICDMWDAHHSGTATLRTGELAPHIDALADAARDRGALIIHAPSSCMDYYADHPARRRAIDAPPAPGAPEDIASWCHWKDDAEKQKGYPVDHSDGGEDDDPVEKAKWSAELKKRGRNPGAPWVRQIGSITIDKGRDTITDDGNEVWNLLHQHGVKHVILAGVHTNMCVLGRPFGLRQMARNGKDVVLARDLTDTMYNPAMRPFVSHFRGTDLVVAHIEANVCPTITGAQITGGPALFRFKDDARKRLVVMVGENEYKTEETLSAFVENHLQDDFSIEYVFPHQDDPNSFPEVSKLAGADLLLLSVRRRTLPGEQLRIVREFVDAGKPVVALRTASHAFSLREKNPPEGHGSWDSFDADVLGGNYQGHHGNKLATTARVAEGAPGDHPVLAGIGRDDAPFATGGSLYVNTPLRKGTTVLLTGNAEGITNPEPVAWVYHSPAGGRVFYTSLGHPGDFQGEAFPRLLKNACLWATGTPAR